MLLPLWIAALMESAPLSTTLQASGITIGALLIWWLIIEIIGRINASSSILLTALIGIWLALAIIVPETSKAAIDSNNPVPEGGEILLLQRETVNGAWDLPKEDTMKPFIEEHPELADYAAIEGPWAWKWYYAFQHVGDQKVANLANQYRDARLARDEQAGIAALLSPTSFVERAFEKLAGTDARAMIAYEDNVRDFHAQLRAFHYPLMFPEKPYDPELLKKLPVYSPQL
jgi:ABC-2 type transport system permease protein